ncbi:MAG TPA: dTDP-4-dehydrorhamnose reductase [Chthoniobacterales bacterium]
MKLAILGSNGRLGATLCQEWRERFEIQPIGRAQLDLAHEMAVREFARSIQADAVLNPAGLTSLEACEDQPGAANAINARAPELLAAGLAARDIPLLHFSTDYVFDGSKSGLYTEADTARPISLYGRSKLAGEEAVLAASPRHWVLRVSWLFDGGRRAFPDQILEQARTQDRIEAVADKISVPTSCRDLADWLADLLPDLSREGGLYHACSRGRCTWQEYAQFILDAIPHPRCRQLTPIRLRDVPFFRAARPANSAMDSARFFRRLGRDAPDWQSALTKFLHRLTNPA